jgi:hypothetical protein
MCWNLEPFEIQRSNKNLYHSSSDQRFDTDMVLFDIFVLKFTISK